MPTITVYHLLKEVNFAENSQTKIDSVVYKLFDNSNEYCAYINAHAEDINVTRTYLGRTRVWKPGEDL
jgi:hypothetical protein